MNLDVNSILEKLKNILKINSDKELAKVLDISHITIASWKQRKTLDFKKIIELAIEYDIDLNFLFKEKYVIKKSDNKPNEFEEYVIYQLRKIKKLDRNNIFLFFNPTFEFLTRCLKQTDDFDFSQLNKKNAKSTLISFVRKCKKNVFLDREMKRDKLIVEIEEEFSNIECYVLLKFKEYFL